MTDFKPQMAAAAQEWGVARRYRSAIPLTVGSVAGFGFLFIGLAMVIDRASAGPGATEVGAIVMAAGCLMTGLAVTSYAELMPTGLAYRYDFRHRVVIPWACIESLQIGRGPGISMLSGLWVGVRGGKPVLVGSIAGTRRYVGRVITEIEAYCRHVQLTVIDEVDQRSP